MTIHFDNNLTEQAIKILNESLDMINAKKDFDKTNHMIEFTNCYSKIELVAFDKEMRKKYLEINAMVEAAKLVKWVEKINSNGPYQKSSEEIECLKQDKFGILTHALIKSCKIFNCFDYFDKNYVI